jgi:hypothetical protein
MNSLTEKIGLMIQPITDGIKRIEGEIGYLKQGATAYVTIQDFRDKCREIEDLKKFVWRVSGGLAVVSFLAGLLMKIVK